MFKEILEKVTCAPDKKRKCLKDKLKKQKTVEVSTVQGKTYVVDKTSFELDDNDKITAYKFDGDPVDIYLCDIVSSN